MKYIITENRLHDLASKYLDGMTWWEWDIGDGEFDLADGEFNPDKILYRIQYSSTDPDHSFEVIYVSDKLVSKLSKLFSIAPKESLKMIIEWFNKRYDKSLTIANFEWMDDEDGDEEN